VGAWGIFLFPQKNQGLETVLFFGISNIGFLFRGCGGYFSFSAKRKISPAKKTH